MVLEHFARHILQVVHCIGCFASVVANPAGKEPEVVLAVRFAWLPVQELGLTDAEVVIVKGAVAMLVAGLDPVVVEVLQMEERVLQN